ncbi:MAG: C4-dicarboxylate transporter DcuC [Negativicutes bacterium]
MSLYFGGVIVIAAIYLLVKQYETRMVLFCSGLLLATIAGQPFAAFKAFSMAMTESKIFESIVAVMGFAMVLKVTECDKHLIYLLARNLKKVGPLLIPGTVLVTLFINTAITSAAGTSAAVGAILIPLLVATGVHPAMAASAVFAGTFGGNFNPGFSQIVVAAEVAKTTPIEVVANHFWALSVAGIISALSLYVIACIRKEKNGYVSSANQSLVNADEFSVNYIKALVPLLPLAILILGAKNYVPAFKEFAISHAMIIGVFAAFAVTRVNPGKISKEFWRGVGDAFGHIFGIVIASLVFVEGMKVVGIVKALITAMISFPEIAKLSAAFGPFLLAVICGSGDAPAVAFNRAVTINADQFGVHPIDMGGMVAIGAALGRTMSPIAGAAIICAALANVSPIELAKRNAAGMLIACVVVMGMLFY